MMMRNESQKRLKARREANAAARREQMVKLNSSTAVKNQTAGSVPVKTEDPSAKKE